MNIGFLADKIPYAERRGWGVYSYQLITALLEVDKDNRYRCFYNLAGRGRREYVVDSVGLALDNHLWPLPGRFMDLVWDRWRLLPVEMFLGQIDVLHIPYELLPPVRSARTVVTVHDVTFLRHPEYLEPSFVELFSRRIRHIAKAADRIVTDSHNTKEELLELTDAEEDRVVVVHNGVDESFRPVRDAEHLRRVFHRYGVSPPYVLFVGAADDDKNLVRLAEAIGKIRKQAPEIQLIMAGRDTWGYDRLMQRLEEAKLDAGVHRTGFVANTDLAALYSGADVLAIPSIHEGFGLPALEAMACGTAVLASNVASLPEVVGDTGVLVDPYSVDAIHEGLHRLLFDGEFRTRCEIEGRKRSAEFSWKDTATKILQVYRELGS